jgi:hypothetical protein
MVERFLEFSRKGPWYGQENQSCLAKMNSVKTQASSVRILASMMLLSTLTIGGFFGLSDGASAD